jgi:hypothetical protein
MKPEGRRKKTDFKERTKGKIRKINNKRIRIM